MDINGVVRPSIKQRIVNSWKGQKFLDSGGFNFLEIARFRFPRIEAVRIIGRGSFGVSQKIDEGACNIIAPHTANHEEDRDVSLFRIWRNAAVRCVRVYMRVYGALFSDLPHFRLYPPHRALIFLPVYFLIVTFSLPPTFRWFYFESPPHRFHPYFYIPSMNLFDWLARTILEIIVSQRVSNFSPPFLLTGACSTFGIRKL